MANFVEQATLIVKDQSTPQINKINKALKELQKTARSLKNVKVDINVNDKGLQQAIVNLRRLRAELNSVKAAARSVNLGVSTGGVRQAQAAVRGLTRQVQALGTAHRAASAGFIMPQHVQHAQSMNHQLVRMNRLLRMGGGGGGVVGAVAGAAAAAGGGGGGGQGYRRGRGGGGPINLSGNQAVRGLSGLGAGLSGISVGLTGATIYTLATAVGRAAKAGVMDSDVGRMSLAHKQLSPMERAYADQAIRDIGKEKAGLPGGALLNVGQRQLSFSEALGATQGNMAGAQALTSRLEETTMSLVALGKGFEEAQEQSISFGKGFAQMGRMTDPRTGEFDMTRMTASFDYITKLMPTIGKEFTGTFFRNITKYLGATKFAITDRALGAVMMLGEETGTRAAVGYGQAVKQFSGIGLTKQAMAEQAAFGLRDVTLGKKGKKTYGGVVDKELLQTDLPAWINKHIIPRMEAQAPGSSSDPQKVTDLMQRLLSHGTARETGAAFTYRSQETQRDLDLIDMRAGDVGTQREINKKSVAVAAASLQNSFQSMTGEFIMGYQQPITNVMQQASKAMNEQAASFAAGGGPDGSQILTTLGAFGAAVLAPAALSAMQNPATAALGAAGLTLGAAGSALLTAAGALGLVAGVTIAGTTPVGGKSNVPAIEETRKLQERLNKAHGELTRAEEERTSVTKKIIGASELDPEGNDRNQERLIQLNEQIQELQGEIPAIVKKLNEWFKDPKKLEEFLKGQADATRLTPAQVAADQEKRLAEFRERRARYEAQQGLAEQKIRRQTVQKVEWPSMKKLAPPTPQEAARRSRQAIRQQAAAEIIRTGADFPRAGTKGGQRAPLIPIPRSGQAIILTEPLIRAANPVFKFGEATSSGPINQFVAGAAKTIAGQIGLGGIPLPGVSTMPPGHVPGTTPGVTSEADKITSAVSAGKTALAEGATAAVETIAKGMGGAGKTLGDAAVSSIQAGVSNLKINVAVNQTGGAANTGGQHVNPGD